MKEEPKTLLEVKYQKAFSLYNQKEKEFFNAFNSDRGDWVLAQREMVEAWKRVDEIIQEIIKLKNKVRRVKK
jgi:polyhydroxyalkanoate synthesis regulator phasin